MPLRVVLGADMGDVRRETLLTELHQRVRDFARARDRCPSCGRRRRTANSSGSVSCCSSIAGLGTDLWGHVAMEVEFGFGEREQAFASLGYRF